MTGSCSWVAEGQQMWSRDGAQLALNVCHLQSKLPYREGRSKRRGEERRGDEARGGERRNEAECLVKVQGSGGTTPGAERNICAPFSDVSSPFNSPRFFPLSFCSL